MISEPTLIVARLARTLQDVGIPYVIAGSFASSLHGIPRTTQNVDIVADLKLGRVNSLVSALQDDLFVDASAVEEAVRRVGSFNALHQATMFKVDMFVSPQDEWSLGRIKRGATVEFETPEGKVPARFSSLEDTLLHKLIWYRMGNEVSETQWRDVIGMLKVKRESLDRLYLERWAPILKVEDLLQRAEAEIES